MRKLMWFTLGFAGASALVGYLNMAGLLLLLGVLFAGAALGCWYISSGRPKLRIVSVVLLGAMMGSLWCWIFDGWKVAPLESLHNRTVEAELLLRDDTWETEYGSAGEAELLYAGKRYKTRVYLDDQVPRSPGDTVRGQFRFVATMDNDRYTYYLGEGIYLIASQEGELTEVPAAEIPLRLLPRYFYHRLTALVEQLFPEDVTVFVKALLVGEDHELDYGTETALNSSGIRHIIAVSGMHVTILFSVLSFLTGRRRGLLALLGIPVLLLFAAVVGFTPSVTRACIMQILIILAMLINREFDQLTALAFAALVMLVVNPMVILSVSFQLSVSCMTGIVILSPGIKSWLLDEKRLGRWRGRNLKSRLCKWFASSVSMTLGATVLTVPLSALHFGAVSLVSVITNLLTLWVVTVLFCSVLVICAVGFFFPTVGVFLAGIAAWGVRYVLAVAGLMADFPLAAVYTRSLAIVIWLIGSYLLFILCIFWKHPYRWLCGCAVALGLVVAVGISWLTPMLDECRVTVLDVGQGQCILFQSEGKSFLVDCGGSYPDTAADAAAETLLSQGIGSLDGLILTHYDEDHAGGAAMLLSRIPAKQLYLPVAPDEAGYGSELEQITDSQAISVAGDLELTYGNTKITMLVPDLGKTSNESSICVLFQTENCDILITGDTDIPGERRLLKRVALPELELLVVGHHGSKNATSEELLSACKPDTAVISVGKYNRYGHPSGEALERLAAMNCEIYRTDLHGTVIFKG